MSDAEIKSSLPLQVLLYFHKPFSVAFFVVNVLLLFYKGERAPSGCHSRDFASLPSCVQAPSSLIPPHALRWRHYSCYSTCR